MRIPWLAALTACGGPSAPQTPVAPPIVAAASPDAAPDAPPPDAGVPDDVATAPAWVFRYTAADRRETWTLRYHGDGALVTVESARGTTRYLGTATDGTTLALALTSGPTKLALDCKRAERPVGATKCNDGKAKKIGVLDCYHPDFNAPMTFGPAPGIEFDASAGCNGYHLIEP